MKYFGLPLRVTATLVVFSFFISCASKRDISYLQQPIASTEVINYEPLLQPDDVLMILISAENPEVVAPYNMGLATIQPTSEGASGQSQSRVNPYLIDSEGNIDFPILGKMKLAGLTRVQAIDKIKAALALSVQNPTVTLRLVNFKVSVLGEVNRPGVHNIQSNRVTLLEALSLSGDLTIYGNRKGILLLREKDGVKTMERIDITQSDFISSPHYYLCQNDVIYVEPNKTKMNSSVIGPNITVGISALSLAITIFALIVR